MSTLDNVARAVAPLITEAELRSLIEMTEGAYRSLWPAATSAENADVSQAWAIAAEQGLTEFDDPALVSLAVILQRELGASANPVPLVDIALASIAARQCGKDDIVESIAAGVVRPVVGLTADGSPAGEVHARWLEMAQAATHILVLDRDTESLGWYSLADGEVHTQDGIASPAWSRVRLTGEPEWTVPATSFAQFITLRRVGLAARVVGALERSTALAHEFACTRKQFGRLIGSFQAVAHRLVDAHVELVAASELLTQAIDKMVRADAGAEIAAETFVEHVVAHAATLQFDAQHTLAATGYFEEHEAPWLFRRIHADLGVLTANAPKATVGQMLLEHGAALPDDADDESAARIRAEVQEAFSPWLEARPSHLHFWDDEAREVLRSRGWIGVGWPAEVGGGNWPASDLVAFSETLAYVNPPLGNLMLGVNSVAPMIIRNGPEHLRDLVLQEIRKGELSIALGYSEPEAGSDLASLRTRAERVDGGWRVTGQKMWGTCFPDSKWILLAARTNPDAQPRHAGITLFLVDTDSPGLTSSDHRSLAGGISSTTFWDGVFVPDERRIGEVDDGWRALMEALAAERILIGGTVMKARRTFDRLVKIVASQWAHQSPATRQDRTQEVGRLAVRLQAARAVVNSAVRVMASGADAGSAGGIAKMMATQLGEDLNATAVSLLGPDALLSWGEEGSVGNGYFEDGLRSSVMSAIAGGTLDIQRNIIAKAIGLPR